MKKFICLQCGSSEYSSYDNGEPCQRCMGKMFEVPMNRRDLATDKEKRRCRMHTNETMQKVREQATDSNEATERCEIFDLIESLQAQLAEAHRKVQAARNELCLKCGQYREAHKGACDGCRWKESENEF